MGLLLNIYSVTCCGEMAFPGSKLGGGELYDAALQVLAGSVGSAALTAAESNSSRSDSTPEKWARG